MPPAVLLLLGSPNSDDGVLSPVALAKCESGLVLLDRHPEWCLLPTGGFGDHFNRSAHPHWTYAHSWLCGHGVAASRVLGGVASTNTLDDAVFAQRRLLALYGQLPETRVLTCAYHLRRARWIFERVFGVEVVHFEVSPDPADDPALPALRAHEPSSLAWYRDRWEELHAASCARWATTVQGGP